MKKITSLFAVASVCIASSSAIAMSGDWSESDLFVGVEGGYAKTKIKVSGGLAEDKSDNTGYYGLRFGSFWEEMARGYISVSQVRPKDTLNISDIRQLNLLLSADYLFLPDSEFKPFLGLTIGATSTKASSAPTSELSSDSIKSKWGFSYGVQAGVLYEIDNFDIEAGLKYLTNSATHSYERRHDVNLKVNDYRQVYLAASYHF